jgi:prolipoprotein diacylglyceryl transferase
MLPYLPIGPLLLQTSGLAVLIGVWLGLSFVEKEAARLNLHKEHVYNMVFVGLLAGVIGARLGYALRFLSAYLDEPLSLFSLNLNTLSLSDGLFIGLLAALVYGYRKELPLFPTLDALAPGLAIFIIAVGVSHFLSGDAFGTPTSLPWGIYLWDENRHPTQIYEILGAFVTFLVVWKRPLGRAGDGLNLLLFVILSAASRLFLEAFRGDSLVWFGSLRAAQIISLVVLLFSLTFTRILWEKNEVDEKA